jgi:hypothetical protein
MYRVAQGIYNGMDFLFSSAMADTKVLTLGIF